MYAKSSPGDTYHLLTEAGDKTLCGLSVVPIVIDRPVKTSGLHLTSKEPPDHPLCEDCARIRTDEQKGGE
jgi:hypothetical protein